MKLVKTGAAILAVSTLAACAKHTHEIQPQYTSPMQYNSYSCKQIERELQVLTRRVSEVGGKVEADANSDDVEMGVGLILFWPTLFFLDGDTPQATEYARLTGEFRALEEAAIQKNCGFHIEHPLPAKAKAAKDTTSDYPTGTSRR